MIRTIAYGLGWLAAFAMFIYAWLVLLQAAA
jgi:hypothetical protein